MKVQYHKPIMAQEVLESLRVRAGGKYIDCTLGDGGHTLEILRKGGRVLGLDVSEKSLARAIQRVKQVGLSEAFVPVCGNFKDVDNIASRCDFSKVDGILFDLGYSTTQLKDELGISFSEDSPLDMRLDKSLGVTAADLLNSLSEKELTRLFYENSDERYAKRFARAIVKNRELKKFQTAKELSKFLAGVAPPGYDYGRIHPATRVFQALRIAVNDEFGNLEKALPRAARLLLPGGRMVVITFHSLEDKLVKEFGRSVRSVLIPIIKKPVTPTASEVSSNPSARSAKMRVFERARTL